MNGLTRNRRTHEFRELFGRLPDHVQQLAVAAFELFLEDPSHPSLRHHPLGDNKKGQHRSGSFSVSINLRYRAIYVRDGDTDVWYWVGSHSDYNAFTGGK
jgi:hypothetical protein